MSKTPDFLSEAAQETGDESVRQRLIDDIKDRATQLILSRGKNNPTGNNPLHWGYEAIVDVDVEEDEPVPVTINFSAVGLKPDGTFEEVPVGEGILIDITGFKSVGLHSGQRINSSIKDLREWQEVLEAVEATEQVPVAA